MSAAKGRSLVLLATSTGLDYLKPFKSDFSRNTRLYSQFSCPFPKELAANKKPSFDRRNNAWVFGSRKSFVSRTSSSASGDGEKNILPAVAFVCSMR